MNQFKEIAPVQLMENPFHMIGKDWMVVAAERDSKINMMTASWGGLGVMWNKNVAFVVIRPQRFTKEFVDNSSTFSLSFYDEEYRQTLSYLGRVSGRDEDKVANSGLHPAHIKETPYFEEANIVLICRKLFSQPFDEANFIDTTIPNEMYPNKDYHTLYIAEISQVLVKTDY